MTLLLSARDSGDFECRERLTVTRLPAVVLAAAGLEDDDLRRAVLGDNLRLDLRSSDQGSADLHAVTGADEENLAKRDRVADVARELLDPKSIALRYSILLSARFDDRVH